MARAVIISAVRTPFGRIGGGLADVPATELGSIAIRAGLERAGVDPEEVGYVVMGQVLQAGAGQAPARQAAVGAGIPKEVPADTINKVCASSIRAIEIAELMIEAGRHDVVVTGGMESMSRAPYLLPKARFGYRIGNGEILDHMVFDGLTSSFDGLHMIQQASAVSRDLGISREEQDAWAARSHARAAAAQDAGRFDDEIVAVGELAADESIRRDTTVEKLATLEPVFDPEGTTTAGNAPGVTDGGSCVVVCSEDVGRRSVGSSRSHGSSATRTLPRSSRTSRARPPPLPRRPSRRPVATMDGRRAGRDQRGVRLGREAVDADARRRRGAGQRQRRGRRARSSDRCVRRAHRRDARARAPQERRRPGARGDLLGRRSG